MLAFSRNKLLDILKLGCTLPNLPNVCLHKPIDANFYTFTEGDNDFVQKIKQIMVGGPSNVFSRKAVSDKIFFPKFTNLCKSFVGIDANQLFFYSMCQPMPTRNYSCWDLDAETSKFIPRQDKTRSFENMVLSCFQRMRTDCKIKSLCKTDKQRKRTASVRLGFVPIATLLLRLWDASVTFALIKRYVLLSLNRISNAFSKRNS